jgi:hypothetical protein
VFLPEATVLATITGTLPHDILECLIHQPLESDGVSTDRAFAWRMPMMSRAST